MDIEVVGRHAFLFDDDAVAAFVNSSDALVDWNSLQIDRYDVRHLLSGPLPPRKRRNPQPLVHLFDSSLNSELDHERYLDLPPPSDEQEVEEAENPRDTGGCRAVPFSYENTDNSADQNNAYEGLESSRFNPPFPVPESILDSLPPNDKVHQIIARTAMFVSKHGGQSEIVLRVKQGDNPTFGFLMPDHNLHAYFRFLIDHQELLQSDSDGKTQSVDAIADSNPNKLGVGGALSLLGSVYGSGEDEDSVIGNTQEVENDVSRNVINATTSSASDGSEKTENSKSAAEKDEVSVKHPLHLKEKLSSLKKNPSIGASKALRTSSMKKEDVSGSHSATLEKLKKPVISEPPSDLKILIDKIVDFILKNGKQFEAAFREQDSKQGRFPFLVPSNQYHPYYLKVLQKTQESKVSAKNSFGKDDSGGHGLNKKAPPYKEDDVLSSQYVGSDVPHESDRKEKFKMIIGKSKKDLQGPPSKATQQESGISVDAEAAAAILQAATRGFKNPNLGIISSTALNGDSQGHGSDVGQASGFGHNSLVPDAKGIAKAAVSKTAGEADSEAHLTTEQKLKAERLKRAKMFVTMLKSGTMPPKTEPLGAVSVAPSEPGVSGSGAEVNHAIKEREGSFDPADCSTLKKNENPEINYFGDEHSERRSRRKYRSRSERHEENDEDNEEEEMENKKQERGQDEEGKNHKHSRKKHQSRHSSHEKDYDYHCKKEKSHRRTKKRHRSHRSSHEDDDGEEETDTRYHKHSRKKHSSHRASHEEDQNDHKRSRKKHRSHRSSHHIGDSSKHRKVDSSGDEESQLRNHDSSSATEHRYDDRYVEDRKGSYLEKEELEEGEITSKCSDRSRSAVGHVSRETSVDIASTFARASSQPSETTQVSDDLRAKIRAMLLTTR